MKFYDRLSFSCLLIGEQSSRVFLFVMPCNCRSFRAMSPAMAQSALAEDSAELSAASGGYSEAELQKAGSTRQLLPQQRRATLPHCAER